METSFYYGDVDWMSKEHAQECIDQGKVKAQVYVVPDGGHHFYISNPTGAMENMLKFTHGEDKAMEYA